MKKNKEVKEVLGYNGKNISPLQLLRRGDDFFKEAIAEIEQNTKGIPIFLMGVASASALDLQNILSKTGVWERGEIAILLIRYSIPKILKLQTT